ncbi:SMI1/KNR4 family protein [Paenibacillus filicis]|uniref:SMI1/KNR4 family protein n=1 Tax=Paenibacillus filicis TaxID=669464 RepID=A0ABU9DCJ9_9BACL
MDNQAKLLWQRITEQGSSRKASFEETLHLQPGASDEDFQRLERILGIRLPEEMKDFYKVHNGQHWLAGTSAFVRNLTLSPIAQIVENWEFLQEEFDPDDLEPEIGEEIKPLLWNAKWIPIAENGGGDYLCLDTDPSEAGALGQVLYFWHDWGNRSVEAKNLYAFIEMCLEEEDEPDED